MTIPWAYMIKKHLLIDWVCQSFILPSPHTKNNSQIQETNNATKLKLFFLLSEIWPLDYGQSWGLDFFFLVKIKYLVSWKTDDFVIFWVFDYLKLFVSHWHVTSRNNHMNLHLLHVSFGHCFLCLLGKFWSQQIQGCQG